MPIVIPKGVTVDVENTDGGSSVTVKGPKGTLNQVMHRDMTIKLDSGRVLIERSSDEKEHKALHGLTRAILNNMVVGVTEGFKKELDVVGVGYRAQKQGKTVTLNLGYSHPITIEEAPGITIEVPQSNTPNTAKLVVSGADKQRVGQVAAEIRNLRLLKKDPYPSGRGIRYSNEHIRRKAGKAGKK